MKTCLISMLTMLIISLVACTPKTQDVAKVDIAAVVDLPTSLDKVVKTDEEWRNQLTEQEYYVIRDKGTERPNTGALLKNDKAGVYTCKACALPLFSSATKYDSGTGWPSYYEPINKEYIEEDTDYNLGYARTEVLCARCDGHLGHVFKDGPKPTGLRYCINSVSLAFEQADQAEDQP